jgi:DNA-directed RNA polymerase subunit alpha
MEINNLLKNFKIQKISGKDGESFDSFVFTKLPDNFAITLGNYLRRILLSYVEGVSILGVKIGNKKGFIKSEFVPLDGLVETPPYFIMNLKNLIMKLKEENYDDTDKNIELSINIDNDKDEEYIITGNDVKDPNNLIEIVNSDVYLGTISPKSSINVELHCKNHWGFKKAKDQRNTDLEDLIVIDTNYNPIKTVSFKVVPVVVDLDRQEEQLVLYIKTDASISPKNALKNSLEISKRISNSLLNCFSTD